MTKKKYIHLAIMVALTILISFAPTFGVITRTGMKTLGVFIGVLYGWITFDLIIPSVFGYAALALLGVMSTTGALSSGIGNNNLVVVLVAMVFTGAIDAVGVTRFIANWLVTRKTFRRSPWLLVFGMIFSAYIMGMLGVHLAAIFLLWAVIMQIAKENNIPKGDKLLTFMIMMITAAGFNGVFAVPFRATAMIFEGYFIDTMKLTFDVVPFILLSVATTGTVALVMILAGKFIFRLDASKFILPDDVIEQLQQEKVTKEAKIGFVLLIIYSVALLLPSLFPHVPAMALLSNLGVGGMSCLGLVVLAVISFNGEPLIKMGKVWTKYVDWQLILLLSVTFPIAEAMRAEDAGIMPTVVGTVLPVVSGMGVMKFMIVSMILLGILTQVTHNIVLAAMFIPFLCPLCAQIGGNPYVLWFLMYFTLNASYMTPAASFQSAMVHGHDMTDTKYCYIFGISISLLTWLLAIVITIPLGNLLF